MELAELYQRIVRFRAVLEDAPLPLSPEDVGRQEELITLDQEFRRRTGGTELPDPRVWEVDPKYRPVEEI